MINIGRDADVVVDVVVADWDGPKKKKKESDEAAKGEVSE